MVGQRNVNRSWTLEGFVQICIFGYINIAKLPSNNAIEDKELWTSFQLTIFVYFFKLLGNYTNLLTRMLIKQNGVFNLDVLSFATL